MNDEDYLALITLVQANFRNIGAPELGDQSHYLGEESETGEVRLLPARDRLIAMLRAFERFMAVRDAETYRRAMTRIAEWVEEPPVRAVVLPLPGDEAATIDLQDAPELSEPRRRVHLLIERLAAAEAEPPDGGLTMNQNQAKSEIQQLFASYIQKLSAADHKVLAALTDGKLYELYVLSYVVGNLSGRGFTLSFKGAALQFKWSPGRIRPGDSHFEVVAPHGSPTSVFTWTLSLKRWVAGTLPSTTGAAGTKSTSWWSTGELRVPSEQRGAGWGRVQGGRELLKVDREGGSWGQTGTELLRRSTALRPLAVRDV